MPTPVIRNVEDALHARLKARAAAQGRSMEEEARQVLRAGLEAEPVPAEESLWSAMRALFEPLEDVELDIQRQPGERPPPDFSVPEWDVHDDASDGTGVRRARSTCRS